MAKKIHVISEIEPKFEELFGKIKEIYLLGIDLQYLHGEDNSKVSPEIYESNFLYRIRESFKINFVLKLCTYLDRDDDINILSFVDRLLVNHKNSEWKDRITINELKIYQKQIEDIKETTAIKTLIHFRNKIYAHSDKNFANTELKTELKFVFNELEKLRDQFKKIGNKVFESDYIVRSSHFDKDHYILEDNSRYLELCNLIKSANFENQNYIGVNELNTVLDRYPKPQKYFEHIFKKNIKMKIFAYGSNMNLNRLKRRVPSAVKISNGFIEGYSLKCLKVSKDGSGKATVLRAENKEDLVWGVLFEIDEKEKPQLDRAEGLNYGYDEITIEVIDEKKIHKAQIYIANDKAINKDLKSYNWYKAYITEGAIENGLPKDYIEKLESLDSEQDKNDIRRIKNEHILKGE